MTPTKLRVLISGLLLLCLFPPGANLYSNFYFEFFATNSGISLSHLLVIAGAWTCAVWLWPARIKS